MGTRTANPGQEKAIHADDGTILVSASAGTGKTYVLTQRVLNKLHAGININELLVLTFTNLASSEMNERIRMEIIKDERLHAQLERLPAANISTFDSFTLTLVKKYHYLLGLDANIEIIDDNVYKIIVDKTMDEIFTEYYKTPDPDFTLLYRTFCLKKENVLKDGILSIQQKADLLVNKEEYFSSYRENICSVASYEKIIDEIIDLKIKLLKKENPGFEDFYAELSLKSKQYVKGMISHDEFFAIKIPGIGKKALEYIDKISKKELVYDKNQFTIIKIIKELDHRLDAYKRANNTYCYMDIQKMAIRIVKENPDIRSDLKHRFKEILIDEYQDTSDIQEEFINLIADNNVFMVGDVKQSIYGFRNANINIFKDKCIAYKKRKRGFYPLKISFRSRKEVINTVNAAFENIMNDEESGIVYDEDHHLVYGDMYKESSCDYNTEFLCYKEEDLRENDASTEIEAQIIARDIKEKIENRFIVYDKKEKCLRCAKYSDFAIMLLTAKDNFDKYEKVFRDLNIPLYIAKKEDALDDNWLKVIYHILQLLNIKDLDKIIIDENHKDYKVVKYAFVSVMRSYLYEYDDQKILEYVTEKTLNKTPLYAKIKVMRDKIDEMSLDGVICFIDDEFSAVSKAYKAFDPKKTLVKMEFLVAKAKAFGKLGYKTDEFIDYLTDIFEGNDIPAWGRENKSVEYEDCLNKYEDAVSLLTIHKAKGLEFNICYYAELNKGMNEQDIRKNFIFDQDLGIIINYKNDEGMLDEDIRKELYKLRWKVKEIEERKRCFYVALTRAREKIICIEQIPKPNRSGEPKIKQNSLLSFLGYFDRNTKIKPVKIDELKKYVEVAKEKGNPLQDDVEPFIVHELTLEKHTIADTSFAKKITHLITKQESNKLELGTYLHECLEKLDFITNNKEELGIKKEYYPYIDAFLASDIMKNINQANIYKEYEIYDYINHVHGFIDLLLEYEDHIDIIDYKAKNLNDPEYEKQLNGYKSYIVNKTKKEVHLYLYSILEKKYKML